MIFKKHITRLHKSIATFLLLPIVVFSSYSPAPFLKSDTSFRSNVTPTSLPSSYRLVLNVNGKILAWSLTSGESVELGSSPESIDQSTPVNDYDVFEIKNAPVTLSDKNLGFYHGVWSKDKMKFAFLTIPSMSADQFLFVWSPPAGSQQLISLTGSDSVEYLDPVGWKDENTIILLGRKILGRYDTTINLFEKNITDGQTPRLVTTIKVPLLSSRSFLLTYQYAFLGVDASKSTAYILDLSDYTVQGIQLSPSQVFASNGEGRSIESLGYIDDNSVGKFYADLTADAITPQSQRPPAFMYWPLLDSQRDVLNYPNSPWQAALHKEDTYTDHQGTDLMLDVGTSVYAMGAGSGKVAILYMGCPNIDPKTNNFNGSIHDCKDEVDPNNTDGLGYFNSGNVVIVEYSVTVESQAKLIYLLYGHLKQNSHPAGIAQNAIVTRGQKLAETGHNGISSGPHLHFDVRYSLDKYYDYDDPWGDADTPHEEPDPGTMWVYRPMSPLTIYPAYQDNGRIGNINGYVQDINGQPVPDVAVSASTGGKGATTDASGHYTLENVPEGNTVITARHLTIGDGQQTTNAIAFTSILALPITLNMCIASAMFIGSSEGSNPFCNLPSTPVISISPVTGSFFENPTNVGYFTATQMTPEVFHQTFPVINFNPPSGTLSCSNYINVNETTRPFTDVVSQPDGTCTTIIVEGNGYQAGIGNLAGFQAVFRGNFTVLTATQVTFNFFSDDGWILSIGTNADGVQPSYVSGPLIDPPGVGPFSGFSIVGSYNQDSPVTQNNLLVNFPAGGTYPFELDYTEGLYGELALTLTANSQPLPSGAAISGHVYDQNASPENLLPGSILQVCKTNGECKNAITDANGQYNISGLLPGEYYLTAFPPASFNLLQSTSGPLYLSASQSITDQNIILIPPLLPPLGTSITNRGTGDAGIPIVYWAEPLTLTTQGCPGGSAAYSIIHEGTPIRSGVLTETSSGSYTATIPALYPNHGNAKVHISIDCNGNSSDIIFDIYIDPSGVVLSESGFPLQNVTVALYRSDTVSGPFEFVQNGSSSMSIVNRNNPVLTDKDGRFGWDVVAGYYKVRAEKEGCASPSNPSVAYVETEILRIPPPVTNLQLILRCPNNIEVTVGNNPKGNFPLNAKENRRESFLSTNNGPVNLISLNQMPFLSSQRVIYARTSYSEMMGLPVEQLTKEYLFPYYNNVAMDSQVRVSNVGGVETTIKVYLGSNPDPIDSYTLAAGGATRKNYAGRNGGPLRVTSSASNILATIRVLYGGSSLSELMGFPANLLAKEYLFPYYNNVAMDSQLRVSNVGGASTTISVYLGSSTTPIDQYTLAAGGASRKNYPGKNSGPLRVTSSASDILTTIRVLYAGSSLSELMGFPVGQLSQSYWYPVYDNATLDSQLRVSNVGTATTHITVYAGTEQIDSYDLGKGAAVRRNYPRNTGPLHVVSSTQPILTTIRLLYGSSLYEMTGLPESQLSTQYFFPWYNNYAMDSELRFAVP
jgi:murein DD-endopeptidase MepM/ murein hydrolase activator NlpD